MQRLSAKILFAMSASGMLLASLMYSVNPAHCSWLPPCLFHRVTGLYCPGCGTTRALHQLLHGHLLAAFRLNPLAVAVLPLLGALCVTGRLERMKPMWIWTLLSVIVAFGVLRNLPWPPFTLLTPHS